MDGILAVWKPAGWTSHDVVAKVRRLVKMKRIGHTGTLDPQVTGVLPLALGRSTRVVEYLQELPKAYEAVLQLGIATDTEDMTGTVTERLDHVDVTEEHVRQVVAGFIGEIEQVPPMYSAVRVGGKRLYELAREGQTVERKSRKVTIHEISLLDMDLQQQLPKIRFAVSCSKGTYIRTLCVDIGKKLGVPASMDSLVRTMSAGFTQEECLTLEQIEAMMASGELSSRLIPSDRALSYLRKAVTDSDHARRAMQGQKIPLAAVRTEEDILGHEHVRLRLYAEEGHFIGLYEADRNAGLLLPIKVFS
ncbi:tRNA pseudouridine(55) synthase TruB [Paenibacillus sambharensis]|uniref:tRNA pseudouridine synthase B n=1 Tax=Paenibacillus sambharensis TaxID=1803190 RepID=A0A2W1LPN0_9BACL|nr:tRNA pseudouridine(55) synthase TruB [Paenibacillus sambharensis]PZD93367.1 tRNA pseudouridine(55) synthase TruB [Paenibacillus sambharensis]